MGGGAGSGTAGVRAGKMVIGGGGGLRSCARRVGSLIVRAVRAREGCFRGDRGRDKISV